MFKIQWAGWCKLFSWSRALTITKAAEGYSERYTKATCMFASVYALLLHWGCALKGRCGVQSYSCALGNKDVGRKCDSEHIFTSQAVRTADTERYTARFWRLFPDFSTQMTKLSDLMGQGHVHFTVKWQSETPVPSLYVKNENVVK